MTNPAALIKEFETMINTADKQLAEKLISKDAIFYTPVSPEPLHGPEGYLSIVYWMRSGFSDVQWKLEETITENNKIAVRWSCTGTHDGAFMGVEPSSKKFKTEFMNFYYFNSKNQITNDIAAEGIIPILAQIGLIKLP